MTPLAHIHLEGVVARSSTLVLALALGAGAALWPTGAARAQAASPPTAPSLVPAQSELAFTTRQMGVPVEGQFRRFAAQLQFDPKKPESARLNFTVDLASARIGTAETEAELAKPDWFDTRAFPQASFRSAAVKALGGGRFEVSGQLAIKGQSRDLVVPVALTQAGGLTTAQGSFTLKRLDFRIGEGDWKDTGLVANEVAVRLKLVVSGLPAL